MNLRYNHIVKGSILSASAATIMSIISMMFFPNKLSPTHLLVPMLSGLIITGMFAILELVKDNNDKDAIAILLGACIPAVPMFISSIPYLAKA